MWEIQIFVFGLAVGWVTRSFYEAIKMHRLYERVIRDIQHMEVNERFLDRVFKQCYVEKDKNTFYLYDDESSSFLCQGKSYEDLANCLYKQHNIQVALVRGFDDQHHWFHHGKIKSVDEV